MPSKGGQGVKVEQTHRGLFARNSRRCELAKNSPVLRVRQQLVRVLHRVFGVSVGVSYGKPTAATPSDDI